MIHCHNVDGAWILWRRVDIDSMGVEGSLEINNVRRVAVKAYTLFVSHRASAREKFAIRR
jgi:hypothetical protein